MPGPSIKGTAQVDNLQALYVRRGYPTEEEFKQLAHETEEGFEYRNGSNIDSLDAKSDLQQLPVRIRRSPQLDTQAAADVSRGRAVDQASRASERRACASAPECCESNDETHISAFLPPNSKDPSRSNNPTHVTGLVTPVHTLHGLLIAMPGPSNIRPVTPSSSVFSLDPGDATSLSPPLDHKPSTFSSTSPDHVRQSGPVVAGSTPPLGSSEHSRYASFSAVLAHAFPEFAHISRISQATEIPNHSPHLAPADSPSSNSSKTCDDLGSPQKLSLHETSKENNVYHSEGGSNVDSPVQPSKSNMDAASKHVTGLRIISDGAISGISEISDRTNQLQAVATERHRKASPKLASKRSSSLQSSQTTKRFRQDKRG